MMCSSRSLLAAMAAGAMAGLTFGALWRFGYDRHSAAPLVLTTAVLAAIVAAAVTG